MIAPIERIADFEHRGLSVSVIRYNRDEPVSYAARVYIPKGSDGWCSRYWDDFVNRVPSAMRWHADSVYGYVSFGMKKGVGHHFTAYFDNDDADSIKSDAEAIKTAKLFADSCKFRIDELSKAYVAGAVK